MAESPRKWQELRSMNVVTAVFAGPSEPLSDTGAVARDLMRDILTSENLARVYGIPVRVASYEGLSVVVTGGKDV